MKPLLLAAMPVVLMDGASTDLDRWLAIEPALQAALECRQLLDPADLQGFAPSTHGAWTLKPARSFTVFGLPVAQVQLVIDPDGELGIRYSAIIGRRSLEQARKQVQLLGQGGRFGQLSVNQAYGPQQVEFSCTLEAPGRRHAKPQDHLGWPSAGSGAGYAERSAAHRYFVGQWRR